jgi:hypothetical protein
MKSVMEIEKKRFEAEQIEFEKCKQNFLAGDQISLELSKKSSEEFKGPSIANVRSRTEIDVIGRGSSMFADSS